MSNYFVDRGHFDSSRRHHTFRVFPLSSWKRPRVKFTSLICLQTFENATNTKDSLCKRDCSDDARIVQDEFVSLRHWLQSDVTNTTKLFWISLLLLFFLGGFNFLAMIIDTNNLTKKLRAKLRWRWSSVGNFGLFEGWGKGSRKIWVGFCWGVNNVDGCIIAENSNDFFKPPWEITTLDIWNLKPPRVKFLLILEHSDCI